MVRSGSAGLGFAVLECAGLGLVMVRVCRIRVSGLGFAGLGLVRVRVVRDKVTRLSSHRPQLLKRKESQSEIEPRPLCLPA